MPIETRENVLVHSHIVNLDRIHIGTWIPDGLNKPTEVHLSVILAEADIPLVVRFKGKDYLDEIISQLQSARNEVFIPPHRAASLMIQQAKDAIQELKRIHAENPEAVNAHQMRHLTDAEVHLNLTQSMMEE